MKGMRAVRSVTELKKAGSGSGYEIVYQPKGIASSREQPVIDEISKTNTRAMEASKTHSAAS